MIAIIISAWNGLEYTKRCVASIRTKHPYKVIFVDDGSTDGSAEWAEGQGFIVIRARPPTVSNGLNSGKVGRNYNLAMQKAIELGCSHMIFAHNDLLFHKEAIDNLVDLYERKRSQGHVFHSGVSVEYWWISLGIDKGWETKLEDVDSLVPVDYVETPFLKLWIMTKETFEKIGPFDENFTDGTMNLDGDVKRRLDLVGGGPGKIYSGSRLAWCYHFGANTTKVNKLDADKLIKENEVYLNQKFKLYEEDKTFLQAEIHKKWGT